MKKIVSLQLFLLMFSFSAFSQEGTGNQAKINYLYVSEQSKTQPLKVVYDLIDQCSDSELFKLREHFTYKARVEPTEKNKAILAYIKNHKNQNK
ncbi:hypothetical protein [Fluviicola sp.]|uniref:hypothetical protein n=1 Tax=Fluviicola sp. TaxID=1917219 RepID=UPI002827C6A4|nr:hypothetical protein [Fluviicola sp.]MDR0802072.1 hypothetical protein [Fluviicola sp.]